MRFNSDPRSATPAFCHWALLALIILNPLALRSGWSQPMTTPVSNGKIVFNCLINNRFQVCAMNADGTGHTQLTRGSYNYYPHITADGTSIVFTSFRDGNGNIYVMNADGSGPRRLTFDPSDSIEPAPNRDGSKITYVLLRDGIFNICVMNGDGSGQKQLTHDAYNKGAPELSPDGRQILFVRGAVHGSTSQVSNLWLMNIDGSNLHNLTHDQSSNGAGSFSPDGRQIVFASTRGLATGHWSMTRLFLMNLDGSNVRRIPSTLCWVVSAALQPRWSAACFSNRIWRSWCYEYQWH